MRSEHDVVLGDDYVVRLRPVRRFDEAALYELCVARPDALDASGGSDAPAWSRYPFVARSQASVARYVIRLAADPSPAHAGFVAVTTADHRVIGLAGYERIGDSTLAEVAVVTADPVDSLGVGPVLLDHLAAFARQRGVARFVVPGLAPLLRPRSVVVVGASARPRTIGYELVRTIVAAGYPGSLHVVSPHAPVVAGVPAVRRVSDVEPPVDLAVVAVAAGALAEVIAECAAVGVRAAVVLGVAPDPDVDEIARRFGVQLECSFATPAEAVAVFVGATRTPDRPGTVRTAPEPEASGAS